MTKFSWPYQIHIISYTAPKSYGQILYDPSKYHLPSCGRYLITIPKWCIKTVRNKAKGQTSLCINWTSADSLCTNMSKINSLQSVLNSEVTSCHTLQHGHALLSCTNLTGLNAWLKPVFQEVKRPIQDSIKDFNRQILDLDNHTPKSLLGQCKAYFVANQSPCC